MMHPCTACTCSPLVAIINSTGANTCYHTNNMITTTVTAKVAASEKTLKHKKPWFRQYEKRRVK